MATSRKCGKRVEREGVRLRCQVCGSGNRLTESAREHGWFRCAFCESPERVPGAGDFALQGPAGRVTRIVRPGSSEFETDSDFVLPLPWGVLAIALADLAIAGVLHVIEINDPALAASFTPLLLGLLAAVGAGVLLGSLTRQRLAVRDGRVDLWWVTLGRAWRHRQIETERFHVASYGGRRGGVQIRAPGARLFVYLSEPDSRRWLEREIDEAILDARETELGDRLPCPGCGGPVVEAKAERHEGGLECSHCGTGLVRTRGGIAMPPVRIDNRLGPASKTNPPRPRRERDTLVWSAPPWCRTYPIATPFNVLGLILFDAAVIGGSAWMVWSVPVFKIIAGGVAFGLSLAALGATRSFFANVFGRNTFRLGALYLEHEIRIGPWRYERQRVPLSRLLHLDARLQTLQLDGKRVEGSAVELELKLATHSVLLEPFGRHVLPMVREVVEAVPQRLTAMGRSVVGLGGKRSPRSQ